MKFRLIKKILYAAMILACAASSEAKMNGKLDFYPLAMGKTSFDYGFNRGNKKISIRVNDQSLPAYFLKKEGREKLGFDASYRNFFIGLNKRENSQGYKLARKFDYSRGNRYFEINPEIFSLPEKRLIR